jgi:hypothetical protein
MPTSLYLRSARAVATTVWLRRSTTPFYCGVYGTEKVTMDPLIGTVRRELAAVVRA